MKIREYSGPLTVLAAGVLGFSLICLVSAAALANPGTAPAPDLGPKEIVNAGFSNPISTVVALTEVEITAYIPTPTPTLTETIPPSLTPITYITPTRPFVTWTPLQPTRTRLPREVPTSFPSNVPTRTPSRIPSNTPLPSPTNTRVPTLTFTPSPTEPPPTDTNTPIPPPTDTNTPVPPPTDTNTPVPPPTDTNTPPPTSDTPTQQSIPLPQDTASP